MSLYDACRKKGTRYRESQLHVVQLFNRTKQQNGDLVPDAGEILWLSWGTGSEQDNSKCTLEQSPIHRVDSLNQP